jgi:hypothetical protein
MINEMGVKFETEEITFARSGVILGAYICIISFNFFSKVCLDKHSSTKMVSMGPRVWGIG